MPRLDARRPEGPRPPGGRAPRVRPGQPARRDRDGRSRAVRPPRPGRGGCARAGAARPPLARPRSARPAFHAFHAAGGTPGSPEGGVGGVGWRAPARGRQGGRGMGRPHREIRWGPVQHNGIMVVSWPSQPVRVVTFALDDVHVPVPLVHVPREMSSMSIGASFLTRLIEVFADLDDQPVADAELDLLPRGEVGEVRDGAADLILDPVDLRDRHLLGPAAKP